MKTWTIKYKLQGQWFFRRITKVKGEAHLSQYTIAKNGVPAPYPTPTVEFFREDETIILVPMTGTVLEYGPERHVSILENIEKQKTGEN